MIIVPLRCICVCQNLKVAELAEAVGQQTGTGRTISYNDPNDSLAGRGWPINRNKPK